MVEAEKGKRIDTLNSYIDKNLSYFKDKIDMMEDDRNLDWDKLNNIFRSLINE